MKRVEMGDGVSGSRAHTAKIAAELRARKEARSPDAMEALAAQFATAAAAKGSIELDSPEFSVLQRVASQQLASMGLKKEVVANILSASKWLPPDHEKFNVSVSPPPGFSGYAPSDGSVPPPAELVVSPLSLPEELMVLFEEDTEALQEFIAGYVGAQQLIQAGHALLAGTLSRVHKKALKVLEAQYAAKSNS